MKLKPSKMALFAVSSLGLTFLLAAFARFDVGLGAGLTLTLAGLMLHPIALLLPLPMALLCFVVPTVLAEVLFGNLAMVPCVLVVKTVLVIMLNRVYGYLPAHTRETSLVPLFTHGFWLVLGVTMYDAFAYGLLIGIVGLLTSVVEWGIAGGGGMLLTRPLCRLLRKLNAVEEGVPE